MDAARATPQVSVIVPVHGDRGGLARTLDRLAAQTTDRAMEVVVVDNGANGDLTDVMESHPDARLVTEVVPGSYRARNAGVRVSRGEFLAFTDADCLPLPGWVDAGVAALERASSAVFVGGRIAVTTPTGRRPSAAELWQVAYDLDQEEYVVNRGWAATANVFVRRDDFDRVGPFTDSMESGGDREWGERATRNGVPGVYSAQAQVDHPARPTLRPLVRKLRRVTRGAVARRQLDGAEMYPHGWLETLRPPVRSVWRRSAAVCGDTTSRLRLLAAALWIHYDRLVYGWWLLRPRRASVEG